MSTRIVLPFPASTIVTEGAQYGDREYWSGKKPNRRLVKHFHCAVDLQVAGGLAVRAAADGTVVEVSHSDLRGYMIAIDHGDRTGHRVHMLASRGRPAVGTKVRQGDVIGYVADEDEWGSSSNGDHIHFEYRINDAIRGETTARENTPNPLHYVTTTAGGTGTPIKEDDMANVSKEQLDELLAGARDARALREIFGGSLGPDGKVAGTNGIKLLRGIRDTLEDVGGTLDTIEHQTGWTMSGIGGTQQYQAVRPYLRTILSGVQALIARPGVEIDEGELAAAVVPALAPLVVEALADADIASGADLDEVRAAILGALGEMPEGVLAAFGLQRAKS